MIMIGLLYRFYGRISMVIVVLIRFVWWNDRWCGVRFVSMKVGVMKFVMMFMVIVMIRKVR